MKLIDLPKFVPFQIYSDLIEKIISMAGAIEELASVYQIGTLSNPGISDIDLLFVFKDDTFSKINFSENFSKEEKYILTHLFFVCRENQLSSFLKNTYFTNFRLLFGEDQGITNQHNIDKQNEINQQIALEFLNAFYISLSIQMHLKIVKLRAFLLSVKALKFDLELLDIKDQKLENKIDWFLKLRADYFDKKISQKDIKTNITNFYNSFCMFLDAIQSNRKVYFPKKHFKISKNIEIIQANNLGFKHKGFVLPANLAFGGKKYINIQQKWQTFVFEIPFELCSENKVLKERLDFLVSSTKANKINFPNFISLSTGFNYNYEGN